MSRGPRLRLRLAGPLSALEPEWDSLVPVATLAGLEVGEASVEPHGPVAVVHAPVSERRGSDDHTPFFAAVRALALDVSLLPEGELGRRGAFFFDADSTLVLGEGIDELAARAGVEAEVAAVTDRAMAGELDYADSLRERVALLRGLATSELQEVADSLRLRAGAEDCVRALRARGWPVIVLSGGFEFYLQVIQSRLGVDAVAGNRLEVVDGRLTGGVHGRILDAAGKAEQLRHWRRRSGADFTVAMGDGANDRPLLAAATVGMGVAPRDALLPEVDGILSGASFDRLLPLLGL